MLGAISAPAGRDNFGWRIHKTPHQLRIFVVNSIDVIGAKVAGFFDNWLWSLIHFNLEWYVFNLHLVLILVNLNSWNFFRLGRSGLGGGLSA